MNTAGLTGGAQCSAATERKDGQGGVSSLLLMVDFRGGPVWHLKNYWIWVRPSLCTLTFLGGPEEAQSGYSNTILDLVFFRGGPPCT